MEESHESINDYQLSKVIDYDYLKIAEILNQNENNYHDQIIKKSYSHSLFTPILSYIIEYLNNNKEKPGIIGKSIIDEIKIIYIILNHKIYDLFFKRDKGIIYNETNKIDFNMENENYYLSPIQIEAEISEDKLNEIALTFLGEENYDGDIEELFKFKKKEILSRFKLGYSIQERIMNTLISNSCNKIIELPNLIFYSKNKEKKIFSEIDRIITVNELTEINKFLIYAKAEFRKSKEIVYTNIKEGIKLILERNSCVFIEIKTSMNNLFPKKNDEQINNNDYWSMISSINSGNTNKKNSFTRMYKNMEAFLKLFENLNQKFEKIKLIIIIDSYFPKGFFTDAERFSKSLDENVKINFDFDLYFIHVESDMIYAHDLTKIQNIENKLIEKEKQIKNLEDDVTQLKNESNEKTNTIKNLQNQLKNESNEKTNTIKNLQNQLNNFALKFEEKEKKDKIRKIKKKIQKDNALSKCVEKIIKDDVLQCKIKYKIEENDKKIILDSKTFCRLYYKKEYFNLINDIKNIHSNNLDKYIKENKGKIDNKNLILITDFVFILSLKEIAKKYFINKNLIIKEIADNFFIISFLEPKNPDKTTFVINVDIPGFQLVNFNDIPDINNFIKYYFEIKEKRKDNIINNLNYFPIYNPLTNRNDFYLDIHETDSNNDIMNKAVFLVIEPLNEPEDLKLNFYENSYKYIILLYKTYFFEIPDETKEKNFLNKLYKFIFQNEEYDYEFFNIRNDIINLEEISSKKLCRIKGENILFIENKDKNTIDLKFKVKDINSEQNFMINTDSIIDKNIKCLIDSIHFKKNKKINVLIEQSCNALYKYLVNIYKNGDFILLNNNIYEKDINDLKKSITTYEKNEINSNIISYIGQNNDKKFDLIIIENSFYIYNSLLDDNKLLEAIRNHLNENGRFIIRLIVDNIYQRNYVCDKLSSEFKNVEILNENHIFMLNTVLSCSSK